MMTKLSLKNYTLKCFLVFRYDKAALRNKPFLLFSFVPFILFSLFFSLLKCITKPTDMTQRSNTSFVVTMYII